MSFLAFALPIFYLIHCFEEFVFPGGFISWYHSYRPTLNQQSNAYYWRVNIIAFLIVLVNSCYYFISHGNNNSGLLIASSFLAWNALVTHVIGSIKSKQYSPGLVTGILCYIMSFLTITYLIISNHLLPMYLIIIYALLGMLYEFWNLSKNKFHA